MSTVNQSSQAVASPGQNGGEILRSAGREKDALYQGGRLVARVAEAEIDLASKEVRFGEIYNSDDLIIPDECEFQEYRILIQQIAYATKIHRGEEHKGRVLRGVTCDLLGSAAL